MINKQLFDSLKVYQYSNNLEVARLFPTLLSNFLCLISVTFPPCLVMNLKYPADALLKFQMQFGSAIANNAFDSLDDILLDLLSSYCCIFSPFEKKITICDVAKDRFIRLCNSFSGKSWEEICPALVDGIYELLSSCNVDGHPLDLG